MRELDCDFCGGTAAGAYEVIPAELDPTPDEQARVVLCDSCRETLDGVLTPLLTRLDAGDAAPTSSFAADAAGHSSPPADPNAGDDTDSSDESDESDESVEFDDDSGIAIDIAGGTAASEESESDPEPAAADAEDDTASVSDDDAVETAATAAAAAADATEESGSTNQPREEPPNFRKVMRFLNNREFPVDRAEVAEFAAGAYDLEDEEVSEIFEYAIERGVLAEENGQLVKG